MVCSDPFSFFTLAGQLTAAGYQVEPLTDISRNTYARYRVTDPGQPDGVVGDELMAILEATKPTFAWVKPHLRTGARIGPADTVLVATDSADPWRFSAGLLHGSWIAPEAVDHPRLLSQRRHRRPGDLHDARTDQGL